MGDSRRPFPFMDPFSYSYSRWYRQRFRVPFVPDIKLKKVKVKNIPVYKGVCYCNYQFSKTSDIIHTCNIADENQDLANPFRHSYYPPLGNLFYSFFEFEKALSLLFSLHNITEEKEKIIIVSNRLGIIHAEFAEIYQQYNRTHNPPLNTTYFNLITHLRIFNVIINRVQNRKHTQFELNKAAYPKERILCNCSFCLFFYEESNMSNAFTLQGVPNLYVMLEHIN